MRILVTGCCLGLGYELCFFLAELGHEIIGSDRVEAPPAELAAVLKQYYCQDLATAVLSDFTRMATEVPALDAVINNAGLKFFKPFSEITELELETVLKVNFTAPVLICRAFLAQGCRLFINISSNAALKGYRGASLYASSKAALLVFTQALADEYPRVGFHTLCPETIATDAYKKTHPQVNYKKLVQPKSVFDTVRFILEKKPAQVQFNLISFKAKIKYLLQTCRLFLRS